MEEARNCSLHGIALYRSRPPRLSEAIASFTAGIELAPRATEVRARLLANRAAARLEARCFDKAVTDCVSALNELQAASCGALDTAPLTSLRARVKARRKRAERYTDRAHATAASARAYLAASKWGAAVEAFEQALQCCDAGDADARSALHGGRCDALIKLGAFDRALLDAEAALRCAASPRAEMEVRASKLRRLVLSRAGVPPRRSCSGAVGAAKPGATIAPASTAAPRTTRVLVSRARAVEIDVREVYIHSTGGRLWHGALALASWLVHGPGRAALLEPLVQSGGRLLEVGAGVGLVGLAAARVGVHDVVLSDIDPEVLDSLRIAVADARLAGARVVRLDYSVATAPQLGARDEAAHELGGSASGSATFDLVVGSEVIYKDGHAHLARALSELLAKPRGVAVLCLADGRLGIAGFVASCSEVGLAVAIEPLRGAALERLRADAEEPEMCEGRAVSLFTVRWGV